MPDLIDSTPAESSSPQTTPADPYAEALADIAIQIQQLTTAFVELDNLHTQEKELSSACDEIIAEEKAILENPNGSEKQAVDKLVRIRATRDIRGAKFDAMRKRIAQHTDLVVFDLGLPLRKSLSNLCNALLVARRTRFLRLFNELIPVPFDHGLPFDNETLVRICHPVQDLQRLYNWIGRESRPTAEQELNELRSEVVGRWVSELRTVIAQEGHPTQ